MAAALWIAWSLLFLAALIALRLVRLLVSRVVARVVRALPVGERVARLEGQPPLAIPVPRLREEIGRLESAVADRFPTRPLRWIVRRAMRGGVESYLGGLLAFCAERRAEVIDNRLLCEWLHDRAATWLGTAAADTASGFLRLVVIVLLLLGAGGAAWSLR